MAVFYNQVKMTLEAAFENVSNFIREVLLTMDERGMGAEIRGAESYNDRVKQDIIKILNRIYAEEGAVR